MNFGGIGVEHAALETARFVVLPVPYDLTSTYMAGSRKGPAAILEASANMELFDDELRKETFRAGIHTLPPLEADARGPGFMVERVQKAVEEILDGDRVPILLGGEHSVTIGAVHAMKERYPSISVLHLDAHADMRESYQGSPFSHACVARRIVETCPIVQVGVRSMSVEEAEYVSDNNIMQVSPDNMDGEPQWVKKICDNLSNDVYVSLDLDVFDPAIMPATGTPEPGGMNWKEVIRLISEVSLSCHICGFDVVELCPIPGMIAPDFLAAKLVYRIIGYADRS
ncbi:MAG: agmatinase [Deltaproteobacteria bacterium]|nr:agmatinase [Deltaproteobacteria bacterium]